MSECSPPFFVRLFDYYYLHLFILYRFVVIEHGDTPSLTHTLFRGRDGLRSRSSNPRSGALEMFEPEIDI